MHLKELAWVDFLKKRIKKGRGVLVGIGDDCAYVKVGKQRLVLKSDLFIEDVHFKLGDLSFKTIGMRAIGRLLSDFAACASIPKFIGASIGIPNYLKEKSLKEILKGIRFYEKKYGFVIVGGDTSKSKKLILDIWGIGIAKKFILRSKAKDGDKIFVTAKLGERSFKKP